MHKADVIKGEESNGIGAVIGVSKFLYFNSFVPFRCILSPSGTY